VAQPPSSAASWMYSLDVARKAYFNAASEFLDGGSQMNICPGTRANVNPLARFLHLPGGTRQGEIRVLWVAKWFAEKRASTYRLLAIGYRLFAQR
jgi:hypothetical protein